MTLKIAFLMLLKPRIQFKIEADVSVYKCDLNDDYDADSESGDVNASSAMTSCCESKQVKTKNRCELTKRGWVLRLRS